MFHNNGICDLKTMLSNTFNVNIHRGYHYCVMLFDDTVVLVCMDLGEEV